MIITQILKKNLIFRSSNSLVDAFSKSKIIVHTLLSTSINDALNANLPSIIILRKDHNPMKAYAKKIFNLLYESNVLFYDSIKAAKFIDHIWDKGVDEWWNNKKTQSARVLFCNNFAKSNYEITQDLEKIFKKIIMIILGIHDGHDSSVALLKNGEIIYAAQEERFTSLKGDYGYPKNAISDCLRTTKIKIKEIDQVALASKFTNPVLMKIKRNAQFGVSDWIKEQELYWKPKYTRKKMLVIGTFSKIIKF